MVSNLIFLKEFIYRFLVPSTSMTLKKVEFKKPVTGFILNRILGVIFLEAFHLVEEGICSQEDLDTVCTAGINLQIGLIRLADVIGLDTIHNSLKANYEDTQLDLYKPPQILVDKVKNGEFGMKTKKGFYMY